MTVAGTDYLLRLSGLAVTFVGFSAVVVTLRRALEAQISEIHIYFIRLFIEGGLMVGALGLLPAALTFTGLSEAMLWRVSSAAAALVFTVYGVFLFRRRRSVSGGSIPVTALLDFAIFILATLALWANALAIGVHPSAGPYALALTFFLVLGGWAFVQNLRFFILGSSSTGPEPASPSRQDRRAASPKRLLH